MLISANDTRLQMNVNEPYNNEIERGPLNSMRQNNITYRHQYGRGKEKDQHSRY